MKILVLRLSSLGDLVLAASALEGAEEKHEIHWLVASEYRTVIQGHPRISRIWSYDRKSGMKGWMDLLRQIRRENYDQVLDLHRSLRSFVARVVLMAGTVASRSASRPVWFAVSKQRVRLWGYFILRSLWPERLRPQHWILRYREILGVKTIKQRSLDYLLTGEKKTDEVPFEGKKYYVIMPSSRWKGKNWSVSSYLQLIRELNVPVVILGTQKDEASLELSGLLKKNSIEHRSLVGQNEIRGTCRVIAGSAGFLGGDTGLAHLAQAFQLKTCIIFGPTTKDTGFGPWGQHAVAIEESLWCRPCSKDGRACFRVKNRYLCLSGLEVEKVKSIVQKRWDL